MLLQRHPQARNRRALLGACLLLLLAAGVVLVGFWGFSSSSQSDVPSPDPITWKIPSRPLGVLRGTVVDGAMNTLTVRDETGETHLFDKTDASAAGNASGILIGSTVAVTYLGDGTDDRPNQALFLAVEAPPQPEEAEEETPPTLRELAQSYLDGMTLEEKVGQMFFARRPKENAPQDAADYALGGYLLFTRDIRDRTPEEVAQEVTDCQQAASIPLFIGVDEEGGTVVRVSKFSAFRDEPFPSPQELWQQGGLPAVRADTVEKCGLLHSLGINVNFAPVCDVSQNPEDYIYSRTLGQDGEQTAQYVRAVVEEMAAQNMGSVLKHFPGYGGSRDTHTSIAQDDRPYEDFVRSDFLPFQAGIEAGASMVLVSHNIVSSMDSERPASLSPKVHQILREELGFEGVIITDDLDMAGAKDFAGTEQAAVLAVQAGNDLLCVTDYQVQIPAVLEAVNNGTISIQRIDQSVLRILELKLALGILPQA